MTRISQLIAVVGGVKADTASQLELLAARIRQPQLVSGLRITRRARFEESDQSTEAAALRGAVGSLINAPEESTRVQVTAVDTLIRVEQLVTRLLDVTRTLDAANGIATGDIKVDGEVLLPGVPTSHLLYLEKELAGLHAFIALIPVRDEADEWTEEGTERGVAKTAPVEVSSTKKVPYNHIRFAGDQYHTPQIDVLTRDEVVGWKVTTKFSGALDPARKQILLDRLTILREAVKFAREEANATEVRDVKEGKRIFDWLFRL